MKDISELKTKLSPEEVARVREAAANDPAIVGLADLRKALRFTQEQMAEQLRTSQRNVSSIERRADTYVSTLRRYIEAMGGEVVITAHFGSNEYVIDLDREMHAVRSGQEHDTVPAGAGSSR